jgi:hypothetical protein
MCVVIVLNSTERLKDTIFNNLTQFSASNQKRQIAPRPGTIEGHLARRQGRPEFPGPTALHHIVYMPVELPVIACSSHSAEAVRRVNHILVEATRIDRVCVNIEIGIPPIGDWLNRGCRRGRVGLCQPGVFQIKRWLSVFQGVQQGFNKELLHCAIPCWGRGRTRLTDADPQNSRSTQMAPIIPIVKRSNTIDVAKEGEVATLSRAMFTI